jgi:hypothetical protein
MLMTDLIGYLFACWALGFVMGWKYRQIRLAFYAS